MFNLIEKIDSKSLLDFYYLIESELVWQDSGPKGRQSGIQYKDNEDQFLSATGRARFHDAQFHNLNDVYKGTIIEELINKFSLCRTRWMWVNGYSCYSIHQDVTPRIHIPLITNQSCLFLFPPDKTFHLSRDNIYSVDTRQFHTFINCSDNPRLHLVGAVLA